MVLAQIYRPTSFESLVGQETLVRTLKNALDSGRLPHAFVFHGIRGTGKTTTARILARCLNCVSFDTMTSTPCGTCSSCEAILRDRHMDVTEVDAASHTSVDHVREMIESARYKPVQGRYKVFIIDEAHMLSKSAFNALLKTLEEPPPHVKFVLATTEIKKIPDTVLSRCMRFDLQRITPPILLEHLKSIIQKEGVCVEEEALSLIVRMGEGSVRDSLSLLDQVIALHETEEKGDCVISYKTVSKMLGLCDRGGLFEVIECVLDSRVDEVFEKTQSLIDLGADAIIIIHDMLDVIYGCLCIKKAPQLAQDLSCALLDRERTGHLASKLSLTTLLRFWTLLLKGYHEVKVSPLPHQTLNVVLLKIATIKDLPPLEDLLKIIPMSKPSSVEDDSCSRGGAGSSLPNTFEDLIQWLAHEKNEVVFAHHLKDYVHLIDYEVGRLVFRLHKKAPPSFKKDVRTTLNKVTDISWDITFCDEGGAQTQNEHQKDMDERFEEDIKSHPLVQSVLETFQGSKITIRDL